jgi:hypothetical protein
MIEAEKLTQRYGPVTAVDGLTFTARPGRVTGFPGSNGAGGAVAIGVIAAAGMDPPALRAADWPDSLPPPAAAAAHGSRPGSGSTDGSAPMRHADDGHAGHPVPQPAR